jgi:hypothetical protein
MREGVDRSVRAYLVEGLLVEPKIIVIKDNQRAFLEGRIIVRDGLDRMSAVDILGLAFNS